MPDIKQLDLLPDAEIISRILSGETALFEILIKRNNSDLYKTGMSYGYMHHDVEDLMQEAFINAYLHLGKFENRSSFKTWLIKIMLNQCNQKSKKFSFKNEKATDLLYNEKMEPMFSNLNADAGKKIVNRELIHIIEAAITKMPLEYRMVFSLREINGLSTAETAEALELTEVNVKVRLSRAKTMLRKEIKKMYAPEDIFEFNLVYCDKMVTRVMRVINGMN